MEILHPRKAKEPKKIGRAPKYNLDYYMMMAKNVVEQGMSYREASKIYNVSHGSVHHWKNVLVACFLSILVTTPLMSMFLSGGPDFKIQSS